MSLGAHSALFLVPKSLKSGVRAVQLHIGGGQNPLVLHKVKKLKAWRTKAGFQI